MNQVNVTVSTTTLENRQYETIFVRKNVYGVKRFILLYSLFVTETRRDILGEKQQQQKTWALRNVRNVTVKHI